jgi:hypothetical protein
MESYVRPLEKLLFNLIRGGTVIVDLFLRYRNGSQSKIGRVPSHRLRLGLSAFIYVKDASRSILQQWVS